MLFTTFRGAAITRFANAAVARTLHDEPPDVRLALDNYTQYIRGV